MLLVDLSLSVAKNQGGFRSNMLLYLKASNMDSLWASNTARMQRHGGGRFSDLKGLNSFQGHANLDVEKLFS